MLSKNEEEQTTPFFSVSGRLHILLEIPGFQFHPAEDEQLCHLAKPQWDLQFAYGRL